MDTTFVFKCSINMGMHVMGVHLCMRTMAQHVKGSKLEKQHHLQSWLAKACGSQSKVSAGTVESIKALVNDLNKGPVPDDVEVVIAPNFIHLYQVLQGIRPEITVAAQNCWSTHMGAYTGEVRHLRSRKSDVQSDWQLCSAANGFLTQMQDPMSQMDQRALHGLFGKAKFHLDITVQPASLQSKESCEGCGRTDTNIASTSFKSCSEVHG